MDDDNSSFPISNSNYKSSTSGKGKHGKKRSQRRNEEDDEESQEESEDFKEEVRDVSARQIDFKNANRNDVSFPYDDADDEEIEEQSQEDDMRNDT